MADDREIVVGSLITLACSLGAASLLLKKKRKHSAWVKKYIRERKQYGECNTLLSELAATEVVKCVQYMRMDIDSRSCYPRLSLWFSENQELKNVT